MVYKLPVISSRLAFRIFQFVDGQEKIVTQRDIKQTVKNNFVSYWLDVLTERGLIVRTSDPRATPKLYSSANVPIDVVKQNFKQELWEQMEPKTAYNDWRDAMAIFLDDMSDFYNHVFIMAFKDQMLPNEIAKATSRPVYFIESIVNHLSAIGEVIYEDLKKELGPEPDGRFALPREAE